MASYRAIEAVCKAVIYLLRSNYRPELIDGNELQFAVYSARDFAATTKMIGVSLFLYRIAPNGVHRTPAGRAASDNQRYQTQLPLDLYFLLTAWAQDASIEHAIAGWMLRSMEDMPILTANMLNEGYPHTFRSDEIVTVGLTELSNEELLHTWEVLGQNIYQLSAPYVARTIRIESTHAVSEGRPIQERVFDYHKNGQEST
jgi:hypothetical protein